MDRDLRRAGALLIAALTLALAACSPGSPSAAPAQAPSTPAPSTPAVPRPTVPVPPSPSDTGATPAPDWLGTRELPVGPAGWPEAQVTPPELRDRRIVTVDYLPPPADGAFHATVGPVSPAIQRRYAYLDRGRHLPGMITADGPVAAAFRSIGWTWGGGWSSPTDLMHFSSTGH